MAEIPLTSVRTGSEYRTSWNHFSAICFILPWLFYTACHSKIQPCAKSLW